VSGAFRKARKRRFGVRTARRVATLLSSAGSGRDIPKRTLAEGLKRRQPGKADQLNDACHGTRSLLRLIYTVLWFFSYFNLFLFSH